MVFEYVIADHDEIIADGKLVADNFEIATRLATLEIPADRIEDAAYLEILVRPFITQMPPLVKKANWYTISGTTAEPWDTGTYTV